MTHNDSIPQDAAALSGAPHLHDPRTFLEHAEWLRHLARGLVKDENDAEDIVHEAFGAFASAKSPVRNPRAYLATTVRFLSLKLKRSAGRRAYHEQARSLEQPHEEAAADDVNERMEIMRVVLDEMRGLPAAQSRALGLRYIDGLSAADIAQRDGTTASNVRGLISRGLASLRKRMDGRFDGRAPWSAVLLPWVTVPLPVGPVPGLHESVGSEIGIKTAGTASSLPPTTSTLAASFALMTSFKVLALALPCLLLAVWFGNRTSGGTATRGDAFVGTDTSDIARLDPSRDKAGENADLPLVAPKEGDAARTITSAAPEVDPTFAADLPVDVPGRCIDAATNEPIPGIQLRLIPITGGVPNGDVTMVKTDSDGTFVVSDIAPSFSKLLVETQDDYANPDVVEERAPFPFEGDIEVRVGPTFRFFYKGVPVDESLKLPIVANGKALDFTGMQTANTRKGPLPWVRFSEPLHREVTSLVLTCPDGFTSGRAQVSRRTGIESEPVDVVFRAGGAVEFRTATDAVPKTLVVDLLPKGGAPYESKRLRFRVTQGENVAKARGTHLDPGTYTWTVRLGETELAGEVDVEPMRVAEVPLEELVMETAAVKVLIDATAVPNVDLTRWESQVFFEADPGQATESKLSQLEGSEPGQWTLTIPHLPAGSWMFFIRPEDGYEVEPILLSLQVGAPAPTIVVRKAAKPIDVMITLVDAASGKTLPTAIGYHMDGFKGSELDDAKEGVFPAFGVHPSRPSQFLLRAEGYQTKEITFQPGSDEPKLVVELQNGWRNRVIAIDMASQSFLPGISVHVNGKHVGETGADGAYWLEGDAPPEMIELGLLNPEIEVTMSPFERVGPTLGDPLPGFPFLMRAK